MNTSEAHRDGRIDPDSELSALRLTRRECEQIACALGFAVAELIGFAHEANRGEIECLMRFLSRLRAAGDSLRTSQEGQP